MTTQKYLTIANILRNKILSGEYPAKSKLPYERELIEAFDTSKMTVKKATDILVDEGLITKVKAKGAFVNDFNGTLLGQMREINYFRGATALYADQKIISHVLIFEIIPANALIEKELNLASGDSVYHLKRVRSMAGKPFVVEETWMPVNLISNLKLEHVTQSIYQYIEQQLGYIIEASHRRIEVHAADQVEADLLQIAAGQPVVLTTQNARFLTGQIFEYSKSTHLGETFQLEVFLTRKT
ncbi:MAG: GntR family transcriptional regulator [Streptococcaceae bacterium]|jgi:GntR family transcriptional regulator|nr:GntR family transcriptional regulator [Streptococcaceae bacterium]